MKTLSIEKELEIRFSEVDMMNVVWHGAYVSYMEDARETFGRKYGLSYELYIRERIFAPVVDLKINYKTPLHYGMQPHIRINYRPVDSAKIIFDYEVFDPADGTVFMTATTTQVFMDSGYKLLWYAPEFYQNWKKDQGLL